MTRLILTLLAAATSLLSCGDGSKLTELNEGGLANAWWIEVKVSGNYPRGEIWFRQTNSEGTPLMTTDISVSEGSKPNYTGAAKAFTVRVENRSNCDEPCGYLDAYICPATDTSCTHDKAIHKLEHIKVNSWSVSF